MRIFTLCFFALLELISTSVNAQTDTLPVTSVDPILMGIYDSKYPKKYTISEIKKVKIIQAAIRKSLNKIIWKKKIYAMKLKERVKSSFKENIFPLKFNVFWEKNFALKILNHPNVGQ
jgi:hypothetical protein